MTYRRIFGSVFFSILLAVLAWSPSGSISQQNANLAETALIAGRNVNMVSGTTLPGGDPWLQRQNEPSIAVSTRNPLHLLAGANDYRTVDIPGSEGELPGNTAIAAGDAWLGVYQSINRGESWYTTLLPGYPQDTSGTERGDSLKPYNAAADPVIRPGTNGMFYYSGIAFQRKADGTSGDSALFLARYIDNNNSETAEPIRYVDTHIIDRVSAAEGFIDKPWIAVDIPNAANQTVPISVPGVPTQFVSVNNVYIAYCVFSGSGSTLKSRVLFRSSEDSGMTWSAPLELSTGNDLNQGVTIAVDPGAPKKLYVAWRRFKKGTQTDAILVASSQNGGKKFNEVTTVALINPFDQGSSDYSFRTNSYPVLAMDDQGKLHCAWSARGVGPSGDARIVVSTSNNGSQWSAAKAVDNHAGRGHQWMPSLAYAGGKLMMAWYDQRNDVTGDFNEYIIENHPKFRHTVDVRTAQANPGSNPVFEPSIQVSRYLFGLAEDGETVQQLQYNPPNYPLFKGGHQPFHGDYLEVAPSPLFVLENGKWRFNTASSGTPLYHVAWTDNRDVRPPADNNWTKYTPPTSSYQEGFPNPTTTGDCDGKTTGMRNQNIYTSTISGGVSIGMPRNAKPLSGLGTVGGNLIPRTFVLFVKNATGEIKSFRLKIASPPAGGKASFLEFGALSELDVSTAPYSSVSRSVFVSSTIPNASATILVTEIDRPGGAPRPDGFTGSLVINPDGTNPGISGGDDLAYQELFNPNIINPNIINPNIINPNIINWDPSEVNPNIINPNIINPNIINPNIINPNIINPNFFNPNIINPNIINPNIINPNIINPNIINPNIINPNIINPNIINPNIINAGIVDVVWEIENKGNTASPYTLRTLSTASIPKGIETQLLIYRVSKTPASGSCQLKQEPHFELVANIVNPNIINPNIINPNIINPNIINPDVQNATFYVGPDESAIVTLRIIDPNRGQARMMANGQLFSVENFAETIKFAATAQPADSPDVAAGQTAPKFAATVLLIGTQANLPDGKIGTPYTATLSASGAEGSTASYQWRINSGDLPPGLSLSTAGVISGTPTSVGGVTYPKTHSFILEVSDGTLTNSQQFFITVYNTPAPPALSILTTSLPDAVKDSFYGRTLEAVGGTWPRTWSLASGSLPPGLSLDSAGAINGIPTATGTYPFMVSVVDSSSPPQTASRALSLTVNDTSSHPDVTISGRVFSTSGSGLGGVLMRGLPDEPRTDASGNYAVTVPYGWSGTVTPFVYGCNFVPASRIYPPLTESQSGQNYNAVSGAAAKLGFVQQPTNTIISGPITPAVTVEIQDAAGNRITTATNTVMISLGSNPGGGTLSGTLSRAAVAGVATFNDLSINQAGTSYTLRAASGGLASATSLAFNISSGTPAKLAFKVQPSTAAAGATIVPAVTVEIQDATGNLATTATDTVTIAIQNNPGGGTLSGTLSKPAVGGIATLNDLSINYIGIGYTLSATSGSLTAATSNPFNIFAGIDPSAPWITPGVYDNLVISDRDVWFKVNIEGGKDLQVSTSNAVALQTSNDLDIYLYDIAGNLLTTAFSDKGNETVFLSNVPAGVYFIRIWGSFVKYTLTVATGDFVIGEITGRVTNSLRNGVQNALVFLYPENDSSWTALIAIAPIDGAGNYKIAHAPGNYKLLFSWDERILVIADIYVVAQWYSGKGDFANADIVTIYAGETKSGKDAVLADGAAISGRVTATGGPISQVLVKAYNATGGYSSARTDSSGNYIIKHIPLVDGIRKVQFDAQSAGNFLSEWYNDKTSQSTADPVNIAARATTENINAQLAGGGIISGRVTNSSGSGIANVVVSANDLNFNLIRYGQTDANGNYSIQGLPTGSHKIFFSTSSAGYYVGEWYNDKAPKNEADQVSVTVGQTTSKIDAMLADGGIISGRVTNAAGQGLPNVEIWPSDLNGSFVGVGARTNSTGNYTLGILAGDYKIFFNTYLAGNYVSEWFDDKPSSSAAVQVSVTVGKTTSNIDAMLADGGIISTISGTVMSGASPLAGVVMNGLPGTLTPQTDAAGFYTATVNSGWSGTVTPTLMGHMFTPASRTYTSISANQTDQNYNEVAGAAAKLAFVQQPTNTILGGPITPAVTVEIQDAAGNRIATATNTVTISIGTNPGGGTLSGTLSNAAVAGVATFNDLTISSIGSGYTLNSAASGLIGATSNPFNIFTAGTDMAGAALITSGTYQDIMGPDENNHWFKVAVAEGQDLQVSTGNAEFVVPPGDGYPPDIDVVIYGSAGNTLVCAYSANSDETVYLTDVTAGTYYILIWSKENTKYSLTVTTGEIVGIGEITGVIRNSQGAGVGNLLVEVYPESDGSSAGLKEAVVTNSTGLFKIAYVPGNYKLNITINEYFGIPTDIYVLPQWYDSKADFTNANVVSITAGATNSGHDDQLANGGAISGRITSSSGQPISQTIINTKNPDGSSNFFVRTNNSDFLLGHIRIPIEGYVKVCVTASYHIFAWYNEKYSVEAADHVPVQVRTTTPNINMVVYPNTGAGSIQGRVTAEGSGAGVPNTNVSVWDEAQGVVRSTTTDSGGYFTISNLPTFTARVYFNPPGGSGYAPQWYSGKNSFETADTLNIVYGAPTTGINATLSQKTIQMVEKYISEQEGEPVIDDSRFVIDSLIKPPPSRR
jgi:hypothetical protein